ncbi:MAG: ATP-binding protein [Planctomycetes bacterium]|nr:ATP-binding protein [Planctomycetota bacterium]
MAGELDKESNVLLIASDGDFDQYQANAGENVLFTCVKTAEEAFEALSKYDPRFHTIVMNLELTDMEGLSFIKRIKSHHHWFHLPIIVNTKNADRKQVLECFDAGAYHYIEHPFDDEVFKSILNRSLSDYTRYIYHLEKAQNVNISKLIRSGSFEYKSFKEGYVLSDWLAAICRGKSRDDIVVGFIELLINAVEHGNLQIGYDEKSRLMKEGNYINHIVSRLDEPEFKDKRAKVNFDVSDDKLTATITDEGNGFDYEQYLKLDKKRLFHSHGKGIFMAKSLYFDSIQYNEIGNEVTITVNLT